MGAIFSFGLEDRLSPGMGAVADSLANVTIAAKEATEGEKGLEETQKRLSATMDEMGKRFEAVSNSQRGWTGAATDAAEATVKYRLAVNASREGMAVYQRIINESDGSLNSYARTVRHAELITKGMGNAVDNTARDLVRMTRSAEPIAKTLDSVGKSAQALREPLSQAAQLTRSNRAAWAAMDEAALKTLNGPLQQTSRLVRANTAAWVEMDQAILRTARSGDAFRAWASRPAATVATRAAGSAAANTLAGRVAGTAFMGARVATGTSALAFTGGIYAARGVASVTGMRESKTENREDFSNSTDEQVEAFNKLADISTKTGRDIESVMQEAGKTWEDFGVKIVPAMESNLDRIDAATGKLKSKIVGDFKAAGAAVLDYYTGPITRAVGGVWKEIDATVTRGSDNMVKNIELIGQGWDYTTESANAYFATFTGESKSVKEYREQAKSLRELTEWHEKMEAHREKEVGHFERLRASNAQIEVGVKAQAEARRIAGLETFEQIEAEIRKQKESAGLRAAALQFDENAQKAHTELILRLENQKAEAVQRSAKMKAESERVYREEQARFEQEREQEYNAHLQRIVDASRKRYDDEVAYRKLVYSEAAQTQEEQIQNQQAAALEMMRAEGASTKDLAQQKIRMLEAERDRAIAASKTREERLKAEHEFARRLSKETTAYAVAAHREELEATRKAEDEKRKQIEETAARRRQLAGEGLQKAGFDAQRFLNQQDPAAVRKQLQTRAGVLAARRFDAANRGALQHGSDTQRKRLAVQRKKVVEQARRDAFQKDRMGQTDPGQRVAAQRDLAQANIDAMKGTGQLAKEQIDVMEEQLKAAVETQRTVGELQARLERIEVTSKQLGENAAAQRQRAQRGSVR
ncbi:hypothetical protein Spb1_20470 [Planctopirus ephydatiae]|uniref:Uncharacterized protein n=1 Tax=Planctopirus ephydatiae TaxID=2528019 RepID=A0A518GNK0_9PLAN|nr:hypothetical protein [Planctopirus ephydatiae]QDV30119.1 hypothetical protein Spb1_20470 [Planctopirus ephydatiae]